MHRFLHRLIALSIVVLLSLVSGNANGQQVTIHGTVYNMYRTRPLDAVSVMSSSGKGTTTDSNGNYMLVLDISDSISFSYLGRSTMRFPVKEINVLTGFDIALHVNPTELNEVRIGPKNYRLDSLRNREEYKKIFNYQKPGLTITEPSDNNLGVGLDLDALINMFRFTRNRRLAAFQRRLVEEEHDKFIDHRFNRSIVKKITHLDGDELDSFMVKFRPSYEFTGTTTDYEFYDYIKLANKEYRSGLVRKKGGEMKKEN
ncbi:MAG: hypothetical protein ACHQEM_04000 [Chitinophagales bacterium]